MSRIYTYQTIYDIVNANGDLAPSSFQTTFTGTLTIDLSQYQQQVLKLDFKEFRDTALQSDIQTINITPTVDKLLGITSDGLNQYQPDADGGSAFIAGDRVIINAKKDYAMLFGKKGVAIASPNQVNIDTGKSITLFGAEENGVFLGLPNRGKATQPSILQALLGKTKGDPTPDQLYEPLVLGLKLANLIEDFLVALSNAEMASAISVAKWQPSTQAEFALLANRIPEILSTYAYVDGISHEEIDLETLEKLKAAQQKAKKYLPPTSLSGSVEGVFAEPLPGTAVPPSGSVPAGLDFIPVPSSVTPTSKEYVLVEGGHGAFWPNGNPYTNKPDPRISPAAGDNLHSFTSDIPKYKSTQRSMDLQVEAGFAEFKRKYNKPADVVGMIVQMNEKAVTRQITWKVLIQESKNGIYYKSFRARGSAKSPDRSLPSTLDQINAGRNIKNFKKIYLFEHSIGSLLITQAFAIY